MVPWPLPEGLEREQKHLAIDDPIRFSERPDLLVVVRLRRYLLQLDLSGPL